MGSYQRFSGGTIFGSPTVQEPNGTPAAPSFTNATGTAGVYFPTATTVGLSSNGAAALTFDNTQNATFAAAAKVPAGTVGAPSVSVGTATNGLYAPAANQVALATNGAQALLVDSTQNVTATAGLTVNSASSNAIYLPNGGYLGAAAGGVKVRNDGVGGVLGGGSSINFSANDILFYAATFLTLRMSQTTGQTTSLRATTASKTGNYTILATDAFTVFDNAGAAGSITLTLPASGSTTLGMGVGVHSTAAQIITVAANASDKMGTKAAGSASYACPASVGNVLWARLVSANQWALFSNTGFV